MIDDYDKEFHEGGQDKAQYLYMELESIAAAKNIDIDAMLENTTMEQFMHGMYTAQKQLGVARSTQEKSVFDLMTEEAKPEETSENKIGVWE